MSKVRQAFQFAFRTAVLLAAFGVSTVIGVAGVVAWQVFYGDQEELQKTTILAKIKEETTLYYLDETTRIGSIFESSHRRYVPIDEMPAPVINAIVAAEDKNFYDHVGIDPFAIGTAALEGLANGGRFRRGGSTITQQTVKNIIGDWEASFSRKFREMIKALQLERLYSKRQILEFYLNQFHVAGNGNGVGIAARYYFNKDVHDLHLVEAAFIAGSVKGPGKYNPFIKFTKNDRERAKAFANDRKNYVLGRMFEQGWIGKEEYEEALKTAIPFNKGEFRTAEVALVELVRSQLEKNEVLESLGLKSADDLNIAGLKVYTTLDAQMQEAAQLAMRRNLSRLETVLSGFQPEPQDKYKPKRDLVKDSFVYGRVEAVEGHSTETFRIKMSFGLPSGIISNASLIRYAKLLDLAVGQGYKHYLAQLIKQVKVGDVLFVQVLDYNRDNNIADVELQKRPHISGGMVALDKGEVRAVVSGFDTLGFNRAIYARRQPGSVFKSLVFFAALQLGWSMLDRVDNVRQVFPYQGKFYFPRPDHQSPYDNVSMLWTGVMSENLAAVALGAQLVDKLNFEQFKQLMGVLDLLPHPGESSRDFHYRVSREIGVSLDNEGVKAYHLAKAIDDVAPDLIFAGQQDTLSKMREMWWGEGYLAESSQQRRGLSAEMSGNELGIRMRLLVNNFQRLKALHDQMPQDWQVIQGAVASQGVEKAFSNSNLQGHFARFRVLTTAGMRPELGYEAILEEEQGHSLVSGIPLLEVAGRPLNILDVQAIWGRDSYFGQTGAANIAANDVKLAGYLPAGVFSNLAQMVEQKYETTLAGSDPYFLPRYYNHHDFRIGLGLSYLVKLAEASGVQSKLDPVLSFPLGTSDVTASEVARIYQTFISGKVYRFYKNGGDNQINFIRRIEDRFGNVLYQPEVHEYQLVQPEFALQMREILRKVVTHGTGRRARGELYVALDEADLKGKGKAMNIRLPSFGKTGTTNDHRTSYFAGFIPYPTEFGKPLDAESSYVISSYIGYDLNKVMKRGRQRIYGGSGALPMWTEFGKEIIKIKKYKDFIDPLDIKLLASKEWPLLFDTKRTTPLMVDLPRGLVLRSGGSDDVENWDTTDLASTGETFQNLFALGSSVKSVAYVPSDSGGVSWQPLRLFGPLRKPDKAAWDATLPAVSQVRPVHAVPVQAVPMETALYDEAGHRLDHPPAQTNANEYQDDEEGAPMRPSVGADSRAGSASPAGDDAMGDEEDIW